MNDWDLSVYEKIIGVFKTLPNLNAKKLFAMETNIFR